MSLPLHSTTGSVSVAAGTRQRRGGGTATTATTTATTTTTTAHSDLQSDSEKNAAEHKRKRQLSFSIATAYQRMREKIFSFTRTRLRHRATRIGVRETSSSSSSSFHGKAATIGQWILQHPRHVLAIGCVIAVIIRPSITWKWYIINFGHNYLQGGSLGRRMERWSTRQLLQQKLQREQTELQQLGIFDYSSPLLTNDNAQPFRPLNLQFDTAYRTLLIRRERRAQTLARLERQANDNSTTTGSIPPVLFIPQTTDWIPPRPKSYPHMERIWFDDQEQRQSLQDLCHDKSMGDDMSMGMKVLHRPQRQQHTLHHAWALCVIYYYGGTFVGNRRHVLGGDEPTVGPQAQDTVASSSLATLVYSSMMGSPTTGPADDQQQTVLTSLQAPPRNKVLAFLLQQYVGGDTTTHKALSKTITQDILSSWIPAPNQEVYLRCRDLDHEKDMVVASATAAASSFIQHCPAVETVTNRHDIDWDTLDRTSILRISHRHVASNIRPNSSSDATTSVDISQHVSLEDIPQTTKQPIEAMLYQRGIRPSWICMRCLMMPTHGRMSQCTQFCNPAFTEFVCQSGKNDKTNVVAAAILRPIPVQIRESPTPELPQIPKIIHQTWFEEVTLDRYPQLARVRNSWKQQHAALGDWEYRLYTDDSARRYILDNFPPLFAQAFDALLPGAYKADFFRYLVLMKEGGIYADVDVMLETNLDNFVRPGLSFFVPRDVVGECVDQAFCLWNGLIGAVPGHPIIIKAVERLVNHILNRADVHDMHRTICQNDPNHTEIWKIYTHPILSLSGPCALGMAMNEALGRPSLHAIETGWMSLEKVKAADTEKQDEEDKGSTSTADHEDYGDALILILDKHDLGGFRFSDPERNLIVASTDLAGLDKKARSIANPTQAEIRREIERNSRKRQQGHYSKAGHGSLVWGSQGIYKDALISNVGIHFVVEHVST